MYNHNTSAFRTVEGPDFNDSEHICIETVTRVLPNGRKDQRAAIWYHSTERDAYTYESIFNHCAPPWYMVTCDDEDATDILSSFVCPGNVIRLSFLKIFGDGVWKYMNTKTFEAEEFTSNEMVIKDVQESMEVSRIRKED